MCCERVVGGGVCGFLCHDSFDHSSGRYRIEIGNDAGHRVWIEQDLAALERGGVWHVGVDFERELRRNHTANHADCVFDFGRYFSWCAVYGWSNVLFRNFLYDQFGFSFGGDIGFGCGWLCCDHFNLSRAQCIIDHLSGFGNLLQGSGCRARDAVDQTSRSHRSAENCFSSKIDNVRKRFLIVRLLRPSETKHV